jgi:hypothetical protein
VRRAILAVLSVTAAATLLACQQEVTATVPLDCGGTPQSVTVTAKMPQTVPSGSAFALTIEMSGVSGVELSLSNATPGVVTLGGTSTIQVVSTGAPDDEISVDVVGAHIAGGWVGEPPSPYDPPYQRVDCVPTGATHVGTIVTEAPQGPAEAGSTRVDAAFFTWCVGTAPHNPVISYPYSARVSATVPMQVTPGQTFTLSDLAADVMGYPYGVEVVGGTVPSGSPYITPSSPITVTAGVGGYVSLRFRGFVHPTQPQALTCTTVGSGALATIPVVSAVPG